MKNTVNHGTESIRVTNERVIWWEKRQKILSNESKC